MKNKFLYIGVLVFILFITTSCDKNEYDLIELNSNEVQKAIEDDKSFILAIVNENDVSNENYISSLKKVAEKTKENIYYLDNNFLTFDAQVMLYEMLGIDITSLSFTTFKDGELVDTTTYSSYSKLKDFIGTQRYRDEIDLTDKETVRETLANAHEQYSKGYISSAYYYLSTIWNFSEAKEEYNNNQYYNLVREWENYEQLDNNQARCNIISIYSFSNNIYTVSKVDDFENFEMPNIDEYKSDYYKVLNDIIYISEKEDGVYKEFAKIKLISKNKLIIEKNRKDYVYLMMGE